MRARWLRWREKWSLPVLDLFCFRSMSLPAKTKRAAGLAFHRGPRRCDRTRAGRPPW
jgi:hypothetical protein